ncbi:MAG: hypothetical protein AAFX87_24970 [Bacteroidota bacterium]
MVETEVKSNHKTSQSLKVEEMGRPSEELLDRWEEQYGELICFEIDDNEFWFRQPARMIIEASNSFLFDKNIVGYNDFIINNTILNGQAFLEESPKIRYALHKVVDQIITDKVAKLKKRSRGR